MNTDKNIANSILKDLYTGEELVTAVALIDRIVKKDRTPAKDYSRVLQELIDKGYIEPSDVQYLGENLTYSITFQGREFYLSGGYAPNVKQRLLKWVKNDSGYGNTKWVITIVLTALSIGLSIIAIIKK